MLFKYLKIKIFHKSLGSGDTNTTNTVLHWGRQRRRCTSIHAQNNELLQRKNGRTTKNNLLL